MQKIRIGKQSAGGAGNHSVAAGLSDTQLAAALSAMREAGFVCIKGAVTTETISALNEKMQSDLDVRTPSRNVEAGASRKYTEAMLEKQALARSTEQTVGFGPDYKEADETGFKGFEAEMGSEDFWQNLRLETSVHFVPAGDRCYHLHGHHSTPPPPLYLDWQSRKSDPV